MDALTVILAALVWQAVPAVSPSAVILSATILGMLVNTLAVLAFAWRGGRLVERVDQTMARLSAELALLRDHPAILARVTTQLDGIERRVSRLEGP